MNPTNPKVSVIIPVYNAAKFFTSCIDSVINQSLKEIEIILINDGSTDNSLNIIESFKRKDSRIKVIGQSNKGPGASRNAGVRLAKGEYIGFVDADDTIEPDMFQKLYQETKKANCDFGVCNVNIVETNLNAQRRLRHLKPGIIDFTSERKKAIRNLMQFKYDYANWNKLFLQKQIIDNSLYFAEHITKGEDLLFNLMYFLHSKRGRVINIPLYNYYIRSSSITQNTNISVLNEFVEVAKCFEQYKANSKTPEIEVIFRQEMTQLCFYELMKVIHHICTSNQQSLKKKKRIKNEIEVFTSLNYTGLLAYKNQSLQKRIKIFLFKANLISIYAWLEILYHKLR